MSISGRSISRDKHLWGDIADQLGKAEQFLPFYKGAPFAPNEKDWTALIGDEPTLILLDELPPYFRNAITQPMGGGTLADVTTYAVSDLLSAALKIPRLGIVISNLSGAPTKGLPRKRWLPAQDVTAHVLHRREGDSELDCVGSYGMLRAFERQGRAFCR